MTKYMIYGAGEFGQKCSKVLSRLGHVVTGFVDKNIQLRGTRIDEVEIFHIDDINLTHKENTCVISVLNPEANYFDISNWAVSRFNNIIYPQKFVMQFPEISRFWLAPKDSGSIRKIHTSKIREKLADEKSKKIYDAIVNFRIGVSFELEKLVELHNQYIPDFINFKNSIIFIDVGSYDGDTFRHLRKNEVTISNWLAFEPDPYNFQKLLNFTSSEKNMPLCTLLPIGLSNQMDEFTIVSSGTSSKLSASAESGASLCKVVPFDRVFPNFKCDYLKLDIEGAELNALKGMRETILNNQPLIACSVYHKFDDIPVIFNFLHDLLPKFNFFLRQHAHSGMETVLYCVPSRYLKSCFK